MKNTLRYFSFILIISGLLTSCEFEVTTASLNDIKTCINISGDLCDQDNIVFSPNDPQIYVSCKLKNAPANTKVLFVWKYVEGETIIIDEVTLNSSDHGTDLDMNSSLSRPNNGWPTGKYEVEIKIEGDNPVIKTFTVQ